VNDKNYAIREINKTDYDMCAKSLVETFGKEPWCEHWTYQQAFERIDEMMASRMSRGYVIADADTVVGMCIGRIMTYMDFKEFFIDEFSVNPSVQGQGLGSRLIEHIDLQLKKENVGNMSLNTEEDKPSVKFYEKNGFKIKRQIVFMHN